MKMGELFREIEYVEEALRRYLNVIKQPSIEIEEVPLEEALHRILAEDITANIDIPPFDRAAMDGYAVRAEDTFGASENNPIELKVIGESKIGDPFDGEVNENEAVKIDTGAEVPHGANAVIPIEYVEEEKDIIKVYKQVAPFDNIGKRGEDVKRGMLLLKNGTELKPWDLALIKSIGLKQVKVYRKLRVGVFSTGNELIDDATDVTKLRGKIIDTNRTMIKTLLKELNCVIIDYGIISDEIDEIKNAIKKARSETDILITIGGTSVGERDFLHKAINETGTPGVIIRGITASPGRPLVLSLIDEFPIISLPGYPVATFVDFMEFAIPVIEFLQRKRGYRVPNKVRAKLVRRVSSKPGVRHYVRVKLTKKDTELLAEPIRITGSGVLSSVVKADGFLIIPEDKEGYEAGEEVEIILLRNRIGVWE